MLPIRRVVLYKHGVGYFEPMAGLLSQVKGARVSVEFASRKVEGAVAGIETVMRREGDATLSANRFVLLVDGQSLQSFDDKPFETTENFHRFRLTIPAKKTAKFTVSEKGDEASTYAISSANREIVRVWLESRFIDRKTMEILLASVDLAEKIASLQRQIQDREADVQAIFQNQERLRKNLQALGTSQDEKALRERYVAELGGEEDKLKDHRTEIKLKKQEMEKLDKEWRHRVSGIQFETT